MSEKLDQLKPPRATRRGPGLRGKNPKGTGRKANPAAIRFVEAGLAAQLRPSQIVAGLAVAPYNLSAREGHRYISLVRVTMAEEHERDRPYYKHYVRSSLRTILRRALDSDQLSAAVAAVDRMARLDGLYEEVRVGVTHSGAVEHRHSLSREERASRLYELVSMHAPDRNPGPRMIRAATSDDLPGIPLDAVLVPA